MRLRRLHRAPAALGTVLRRRILAYLRRHRPIVSTRRFGVVTLAADVREVLGRHDVFTVALYAPKMAAVTGPFILGLDDGELYRRDHAALRRAIRQEDSTAIGDAMLAAARERVAAGDGGIDVVSELADPSIDQVVASYFGAPGPDTPTQLRWARNLFQEIFLNVLNRKAVRERALADAADMRRHVDGLVAARKREIASGAEVPDDVLTRLVRMQRDGDGLDDESIRHNLIGLIVGWIPTVSTAFAQMVDELLNRRAELDAAQAAARAGDRDLVAAYTFEALRFRPQTWAVLRKCAADAAVAAGTERERGLRAGATILVATESGMFDETAVTTPDQFRLDRPWTDYLHFGHGLHRCFGEEINRAQLPALLLALLEGPHIARAAGDAGSLRRSGPYPSELRVSFS